MIPSTATLTLCFLYDCGWNVLILLKLDPDDVSGRIAIVLSDLCGNTIRCTIVLPCGDDVDYLPVLPFSKLNKIFIGYFDPENIFLDNKNKYFLG